MTPRCFDTWKARWEGVDILAEYNAGPSPYSYTLGNPVRFSDPTGMISEDENELMQVSTDLWGDQRNQDFMDKSASDASSQAANTQNRQAGYIEAGSDAGLSEGQMQRDTDTYFFNGSNREHSTKEIGRKLSGQRINIYILYLVRSRKASKL